MLDKLHYFLPNTDESVHVYGDGEGFAKFTDGTRTVIVAPWKG